MVHWNAADYHRHSQIQLKWAQELLDKLKLRGDERVLDIGCGEGKVTRQIAQILPAGSALGIDMSPEMIGFARKSLLRAPLPNLQFEQEDASRLPYENEFDVIFSNAALHWIKDQRPVLKGIYKALKKNARILLQMGGQGNAARLVAAAGRLIRASDWEGYFKDFTFPWGFYSSSEYSAWLKEAGLLPLRVELLEKDMAYQERENLAGWIRTTWMPYTTRVPENRREEFISRFIDLYLETDAPDEKGVIHAKMVRLEVEAAKR